MREFIEAIRIAFTNPATLAFIGALILGNLLVAWAATR